MKVTVEFEDTDSLTEAEAVSNAKSLFDDARVTAGPGSGRTSEYYLYYALNSMITEEQIELYFSNVGYEPFMSALKDKTMSKVTEVLNKVIEDNENKLR